MVDILALSLSHGLLLLAAWRLLWRDELDVEGEAPARRRAKPKMRPTMDPGPRMDAGLERDDA